MTLRWIVHNVCAHPLLVVWPRVGEWLHDRTEPEIRLRPGEITTAQTADNALRVFVGGHAVGDLVFDTRTGAPRRTDPVVWKPVEAPDVSRVRAEGERPRRDRESILRALR